MNGYVSGYGLWCELVEYWTWSVWSESDETVVWVSETDVGGRESG